MGYVKFVQGTSSNFVSAQKDENTLYFITDEKRIYKGSTPFAGGIYQAVTSYPTTGDVNVIYVNTTDGSIKFWNGSAYVLMVKPNTSTITSGLATELTTSKAVVDYVTKMINDQDFSTVTNRISTLESQVTTINGAGAGSINKALADAKVYADGKVTTLANGQVTINKNKITALENTIVGKADKATTLSGYGISDAYTKSATNSAISTAVANAGHLKREIVDALPTVASADVNTIYMVLKSGGAGEQKYNEYMLINGVFEKVGDSAVDLTNYATKTEVGTAKTEAIVASGNAADSKISAKVGDIGAITVKTYSDNANSATLNSAKAYSNSLAGNYATAAQGTKADSALQKRDIITGTVNGTINVDGGNVAVKGLNSAAYVATSTFDSAGAATSALNTAKGYSDSQDAINLTNAKSYVDIALTWGTL